jgi:hypothetical protein
VILRGSASTLLRQPSKIVSLGGILRPEQHKEASLVIRPAVQRTVSLSCEVRTVFVFEELADTWNASSRERVLEILAET